MSNLIHFAGLVGPQAGPRGPLYGRGLSAPYDKRPSGAPIISFIFVGISTILFFFVFFSKSNEKVRLSFDDRLSFEYRLSFEDRLSFESTKIHFSNNFMFLICSLIVRYRLSFDDRLSFERKKKHCCRRFQGCSRAVVFLETSRWKASFVLSPCDSLNCFPALFILVQHLYPQFFLIFFFWHGFSW